MFSAKLTEVVDSVDKNIDKVAHVFPTSEENLHDFDDPFKCWCMPNVWVYAGEEVAWDFMTIEHHWTQ